jgi:glycosyltransferase involved in cell wall biosynthesis
LKISVVISTYSKEKATLVRECLKSIQLQSIGPHETLLVLDEDQDLLNFYLKETDQVKVYSSGGRGLSKARNFGVNHAEGDIVAFIDDDAVAEKDWIKKIIDNLQNEDIVGIGGKISPQWENNRPSWFPEEIDWTVGCTYKGLPEERHYIRNPIGCNMAFRKEVIREAGLFEEEIGRMGKVLLGSEETDLSLRILEKHSEFNILYDPNMVVHHKVPTTRTTLRYVLRRAFYEGYSKAFLAKRHKKVKKAFTTENNYFKYLIFKSIPQRLVKIYTKSSFQQFFVLILVILAVGSGYLYGKIRLL